MTASNSQQEQQSQSVDGSHAQLALIGMYVLADNQLTKLMGKVMRLLRRASTPVEVAHAVSMMRRGERRIVDQLERQTPQLLDTLTLSVERAMRTEARRLPPKPPAPPVRMSGNSPRPFDFTVPLGERATSAIRVDLQTELKDIRARILRQHDDLYKLTASGAATHNMLTPGHTIKDAQQNMMRDLLQHGVTGFTDKSGRNWQLSSYVEMAVRTASMRAYNEAHMQVMNAAGVTLFMVPVHMHTCPICHAWQGKILSLTPDDRADATVDEARAAGLWHPNCFPGFVPVSAPSGIRAADSRWYEGELVVIHTASGNELSVTPNHPILTTEGWVAAGSLTEGDHLIRYRSDIHGMDGMSPDHDGIETPIGNVFESLRHSRRSRTLSMPVTPEQFHGDGFDSDVEIVLVDRKLQDRVKSSRSQGLGQQSFRISRVRLFDLLGVRTGNKVGIGSLHASNGLMRSFRLLGSLLRGKRIGIPLSAHMHISSNTSGQQPIAHRGLRDTKPLTDLSLREAGLAKLHHLIKLFDGFRSMLRTKRGGFLQGSHDPGISQALLDSAFTDSEGGRDLSDRLSSLIPPDDVIEIERKRFAGHVYNLQTNSAWYTANSIVVHNCEHVLTSWRQGDKRPTVTEWSEQDEKLWTSSQQQRNLESRIRAQKRVLVNAEDTQMRAVARAKIRRYQAQLRQLTKDTGLLRRSHREQPDLGLRR
ncbi:phage minor capsid protein [Bifidobacterium crudilactis]|jgi:hypothetical protein|uniref:phage minor capsid protein n=1 Tax=Bifidobacterium crudilactis TaxID=327277 RepID=UPI002F352EFC